jgi:hypothetical protein
MDDNWQFAKKIGNNTFDETYGHEQMHIRSMNNEITATKNKHENETGACKYLTNDLCSDAATTLQNTMFDELSKMVHREEDHQDPGKEHNKGAPESGSGHDPNGDVPKTPSTPPGWAKP